MKIKRYGEGVGLYFPRLRPPLCFASIHDACGVKKESAYAQEGIVVILKEDRDIVSDKHTAILPEECVHFLGGPCHILHGSSRTAKRIGGVSTSHKETVAAVSSKEVAQLVALRFTEVLGAGFSLPMYQSPKVTDLIAIQENGSYCFAIDDYTDCADLWELMTGQKGVPQDRHQRLYVLSLREDRMVGKIRHTVLLPTEIMVADALTKVMLSAQFMNLLTTGFLVMKLDNSRLMVRVRTRRRIDIKVTERDLLDMSD